MSYPQLKWTLLVFCGIACAQNTQTPLSLGKTYDKPHQLRDIAIDLQLRGWPVAFEEGPLISASDLVGRTAPNGRAILVRKVVPFYVEVPGNDLDAKDNHARMAVLNRILSSYSSLGNSDTYVVHSSGLYLRITPGRGTAVLDTAISFPEQKFADLQQLLQFVLNEVAQVSGVSMVLGNTPTNLFRHSPVVEVASNEPAREVIARAFAEINGPRLVEGLSPVALPWTVTYDPTNNQYWFDVNAITLTSYGGALQMAHTGATAASTTNTGTHQPPPHTIPRAVMQ